MSLSVFIPLRLVGTSPEGGFVWLLNCIAFVSAAAFATIDYFFPAVFPFFAPLERAVANRTGFGGELAFFHWWLNSLCVEVFPPTSYPPPLASVNDEDFGG